MPLKLYNSLAKQEEEFRPLNRSVVSMYTCGPTVYGRPHIANYSAFLMADLLRRWLQFGHGLKVIHAKNITDVGHLVRDADTGEDKIEKQAREEFGEVTHDSVIGIARKYEAMYLEDEKVLNMLEPDFRPRATEYIDQMKEMIESLLQNGHAYVTDDGIYFDVTSPTLTPYGTLSGNTLENLAAGSRVEVNEAKKHPADFALWKFCVGPNEHHALRWPSPQVGGSGFPNPRLLDPLPDGFPGWHIECSAMSRSLLGDSIDIHTGGEDNIFPHHECEIAQSESVTGKPFVRTWLHKRRIDLAGEKMSKSLGNVLTIIDISEKGYSPLDLRYYFSSVHYRTNLKFSWEGLEAARKARRTIMEWMEEISAMQAAAEGKQTEVNAAHEWKQMFASAMDADLNVSQALAAVFGCASWSRVAPLNDEALSVVREFITLIRHTFGCFTFETKNIPENVQRLVDERAAARAGKNFAESDRLRDAIDALGYEVRDGKEGQIVKKK